MIDHLRAAPGEALGPHVVHPGRGHVIRFAHNSYCGNSPRRGKRELRRRMKVVSDFQARILCLDE